MARNASSGTIRRIADREAILPLLLRRDRLPALLGIIGVTVLAWLYLVWLAAGMGEMNGGMGEMSGADSGGMAAGGMSGMGGSGTSAGAMAGMAMPALHAWTPGYFVLMFLMWSVMMVGMMLPSASPMILLYDRVRERQEAKGASLAGTGVFALGYLAAWALFSLLAVLAQWALEQAALLSPMMASASPRLGGGLLMLAGLYQWTPLKNTCLVHCRAPITFLAHHWRPGRAGAFRMGLHHGLYCVGCCWVLMALLFVFGVMNLLWIAALAIFVLLEKLLPRGDLVGRATGGLMIAAGLWLVLGS
jgi:predicted metal-binding membrane protein